jgi:hypothetical protein
MRGLSIRVAVDPTGSPLSWAMHLHANAMASRSSRPAADSIVRLDDHRRI